MNRTRVSTMRALAAMLLITAASPVLAQTTSPVPTLAKSELPPAPAPKTDAQRERLRVALAKSDELLRAGKSADAIALLESTEKEIPGDAGLAAALGTAFELSGKNAEALDWVRKGIERDAGEHHGSEWLHARILDARIALARDPQWLEKNRVLGLEFGTGDVPVAPEILPIEKGRIKGADQLLEQIDYQLAERAKFTPPPDPVLGDLMASAGDFAIAAAVSPLDDRKSKLRPERYYERALEYGAPRAALIRKRLARYRADLAALPPAPKEEVAEYPAGASRFAPPAPERANGWIYVAVAAGVLVVLVTIGLILDRRRRKRAEAFPPPPLPDVD